MRTALESRAWFTRKRNTTTETVSSYLLKCLPWTSWWRQLNFCRCRLNNQMFTCFPLGTVLCTLLERGKWKSKGLEVFVLNDGRSKPPGFQHWLLPATFSCDFCPRNKAGNIFNLLYCPKEVFITYTRWDEQGSRSFLLAALQQPYCLMYAFCLVGWLVFSAMFCIAAIEIRQVQ